VAVERETRNGKALLSIVQNFHVGIPASINGICFDILLFNSPSLRASSNRGPDPTVANRT
jgi:hypothetical protein